MEKRLTEKEQKAILEQADKEQQERSDEFAKDLAEGSMEGFTTEAIKTKGLKVLVTGGAGFIGSHVARHCLELGMEVVVVDDLSGGFEENIPKGCTFYKASILDRFAMAEIFLRHQFDYVYHLAAYAAESLSHFIGNFNYSNNLVGSVNIINLCVIHKIKCIAFTSSIAVMAEGTPPYDETDPFRPGDPYGVAKMAVEFHLHSARQMFGLQFIIFRPFNVYGPGQNIGDKYRNVIGIFMNQIMQNKPLTVFGDGEQQRSFSYIDDVAPHISKSVLNPRFYNNTYFIGGSQPYTINELIQVISAEFEITPEIKYLQQREEAKVAVASTEKARQAFGPATVSLRDGIHIMAEWARIAGPRQCREFSDIEIKENLPEGWS